MFPGRSQYPTRAAVRSGLAPVPTLPRQSTGGSSTPSGARSSGRGTPASPKSRPVTPELLFSKVVASPPASIQGRGSTPGSAMAPRFSIKHYPLSHDVDFGVLDHANEPSADMRSHVTGMTARTHPTASNPRINFNFTAICGT
ncbi:hypothetical protein GGX14DRAFT_570204 [Mycena pura]|uniref:Uncharacterized protein n=1 Tax=Mycena pura TaxID=153505 RepID=A0AAD6Y7C6_9AGAR|nr:hypothetical protein GGX14DRAFT_570204 [Mycena pura]